MYISIEMLVTMWCGLGLIGFINALQKLYGGIAAGILAIRWELGYDLSVSLMGGPFSLLFSINPWLPLSK